MLRHKLNLYLSAIISFVLAAVYIIKSPYPFGEELVETVIFFIFLTIIFFGIFELIRFLLMRRRVYILSIFLSIVINALLFFLTRGNKGWDCGSGDLVIPECVFSFSAGLPFRINIPYSSDFGIDEWLKVLGNFIFWTIIFFFLALSRRWTRLRNGQGGSKGEFAKN